MAQLCDTIIHAHCIVTQNKERAILYNGSLAITSGNIVALGPKEEICSFWDAKETLDLCNMLVMPGLINAHTHVAMTFFRGLADDLPLMEWLKSYIFPIERHLTPEIVRWSSLLGYAEMLRTGTTACLDMYFFEDVIFEAAVKAGIRCTGGESIFVFPSVSCDTAKTALEHTKKMAELYSDNTRINVVVNPHSVYTTTPQVLSQCIETAEECNLPLHIHLSETTTETQLCLQEYGLRPVSYCRELGILSPRTTLAHVVDVNLEELTCLAEHGCVISHNPSSNMKLASGVSPIPEMIKRNLSVGLGTDGAASNNCLNMFMEMGRCALLHKVYWSDPTVLPAQTVLDMATLGGAAAIHQPKLGVLAPGHPADLIALDISMPNLQPMFNPISHLIYATTGMEVFLTMVEGEILYYNGTFTRFDYVNLSKEMKKVSHWVKEKLQLL